MDRNSGHDEKRATISIVEDDDQLRSSLSHYFKTRFSVYCDATGEAAIKRINSGADIDLLVTDFDLHGDMDGLDVARAMRAKNPHTPIVLMTGSMAKMPRIEALLSISNTSLLGKPFTLTSLDSKVTALLGE